MKVRLFALLALGLVLGAPPAPAGSCGPIDGVEQVLHAPGVFIGDLHGSTEPPTFLGALACHVAKPGRPLVVALEYDARDQAVLDQFLSESDEARAVEVLTATTFWTDNRDGRASGAMRDALLAMRRLARDGAQMKLIAYDLGGESSADRDKKSADLIRRRREGEDAATYWIVFGGNVHARKTKGLPFTNAPPGSEDHEPLGYLIRDWGLIHLDAGYRGGTTWACTGPAPDDCGSIDLGPACAADCPKHPSIRLEATNPAFDGVYEVGSLTISVPVNRQGKN